MAVCAVLLRNGRKTDVVYRKTDVVYRKTDVVCLTTKLYVLLNSLSVDIAARLTCTAVKYTALTFNTLI